MTLVVLSGTHCTCFNDIILFIMLKHSHYYIVISVEKLEDTKAVKESELLPVKEAKRNAHLPLYVTASINYDDVHQTFTIGDGSSSTDPITQAIFYNAPLQKQQEYYYFIRAYSAAHTTEVVITLVVISLTITYICSYTKKLATYLSWE